MDGFAGERIETRKMKAGKYGARRLRNCRERRWKGEFWKEIFRRELDSWALRGEIASVPLKIIMDTRPPSWWPFISAKLKALKPVFDSCSDQAGWLAGWRAYLLSISFPTSWILVLIRVYRIGFLVSILRPLRVYNWISFSIASYEKTISILHSEYNKTLVFRS